MSERHRGRNCSFRAATVEVVVDRLLDQLVRGADAEPALRQLKTLSDDYYTIIQRSNELKQILLKAPKRSIVSRGVERLEQLINFLKVEQLLHSLSGDDDKTAERALNELKTLSDSDFERNIYKQSFALKERIRESLPPTSLPDGWVTKVDPDTGDTYYENRERNQRTFAWPQSDNAQKNPKLVGIRRLDKFLEYVPGYRQTDLACISNFKEGSSTTAFLQSVRNILEQDDYRDFQHYWSATSALKKKAPIEGITMLVDMFINATPGNVKDTAADLLREIAEEVHESDVLKHLVTECEQYSWDENMKRMMNEINEIFRNKKRAEEDADASSH